MAIGILLATGVTLPLTGSMMPQALAQSRVNPGIFPNGRVPDPRDQEWQQEFARVRLNRDQVSRVQELKAVLSVRVQDGATAQGLDEYRDALRQLLSRGQFRTWRQNTDDGSNGPRGERGLPHSRGN